MYYVQKVTSLIVQTSSQKCIVTCNMSDTVRCAGTGMMIRALKGIPLFLVSANPLALYMSIYFKPTYPTTHNTVLHVTG